MNQHEEHGKLMNETLRQLSFLTWRGRRACWADRRIVGTYRRVKSEGMVTIGRKGQADLVGATCSIPLRSGLVLPGLHFEAEAKTGAGALEPEQQDWRDVMQDLGVLWIEFREPHQVGDMLIKALDELAAELA